MNPTIRLTIASGIVLFASLIAAAWQSPPSSLAGTWQAEQSFRRGAQTRSLTSTYIFKVEGDHFTGLTVSARYRREIVAGTVNGEQISFGARNPFVPASTPQTYIGTLANGTLTIKPARPPAPGRASPPPIILRKISQDTVYHLPPELVRPPLPPFRVLQPNGLALTPPMGWNSWNKFHGSVSDRDVRATADLLVSMGMRDAGYVYVNIDDTWEGTRDAQGNIQPNSKFPDMKGLADYVHSKGLKLGIYSSPGPRTCAGYEGSYLHEAQDARTYAAWGIDYLKYDWCSASMVYSPDDMRSAYEKMALALRATGRPIVFSLCQYGWLDVGSWGAEVGGNLWRTTGDISDNYASMAANGFSQNGRENAAGPGHWNDPDMLEIGNGGMTDAAYQTHVSLWAILAAPLLAGNDLSAMTPDIRDILTNREVIAVDQDKLGRQGFRVSQQGDLEVWKRPLAGGALAVGLFNRGAAAATMFVRWSDLGAKPDPKLRDLWAHRTFKAPGSYSVSVPSQGVVLLRVQ